MVDPVEYSYEEQASQPQSDMMMPGYEMSRPSEAALIERLDPTGTLEAIKHLLKGEKFNEETKQWEVVYTPLCSDELINKIMINASSVVNQNTTLSDLKEKEISMQIFNLNRELISLLRLSADKYGVKYEDLNTIWTSIGRMSFNALNRAKNRGEMKLLRTVIRSSEAVQIAPERQQKRKMAIFGGG